VRGGADPEAGGVLVGAERDADLRGGGWGGMRGWGVVVGVGVGWGVQGREEKLAAKKTKTCI